MLNALRSLFSGQPQPGGSHKTVDLEARLSPAAGGQGYGEIEYAAYSDGGRSLEIEVAGIGPGEVVLGGRSFNVSSGRAEFRLSTRQGDEVPEFTEGERVELRRSGAVILGGVFRRD